MPAPPPSPPRLPVLGRLGFGNEGSWWRAHQEEKRSRALSSPATAALARPVMSRPGSPGLTVRKRTWAWEGGRDGHLHQRVLELVVEDGVELGGAVEGPAHHAPRAVTGDQPAAGLGAEASNQSSVLYKGLVVVGEGGPGSTPG